jgi:hypothetical protein
MTAATANRWVQWWVGSVRMHTVSSGLELYRRWRRMPFPPLLTQSIDRAAPHRCLLNPGDRREAGNRLLPGSKRRCCCRCVAAAPLPVLNASHVHVYAFNGEPGREAEPYVQTANVHTADEIERGDAISPSSPPGGRPPRAGGSRAQATRTARPAGLRVIAVGVWRQSETVEADKAERSSGAPGLVERPGARPRLGSKPIKSALCVGFRADCGRGRHSK